MPNEAEVLPTSGSVKWFDPNKGYGFITPQPNGSDIFLHVKELRKSGIVGVNDGATVSFTPVKGPKGIFATEIKVLNGEAPE
jgi:CspA family cold shock protein